MGGTRYGTAEGVLSSMKGEFDVLYEESRLNATNPPLGDAPEDHWAAVSCLRSSTGSWRTPSPTKGVWITTANEVASLA